MKKNILILGDSFMNFNSILKNLGKILNITNKSLPLLSQLRKPITKISSVISKNYNHKNIRPKEKENNNSPKFFQ